MFFIFDLLVPVFRPSLYTMVLFSLYLNLRKQRPEVFCRKRCLQKFRKFHRKTPVLESLFNAAQACNFIKKRLQHRYFPVKFAKFLRTPILKNICERLLLNLSRILRSSIKILQKHTNGKTNFQDVKEYNQKQHCEW